MNRWTTLQAAHHLEKIIQKWESKLLAFVPESKEVFNSGISLTSLFLLPIVRFLILRLNLLPKFQQESARSTASARAFGNSSFLWSMCFEGSIMLSCSRTPSASPEFARQLTLSGTSRHGKFRWTWCQVCPEHKLLQRGIDFQYGKSLPVVWRGRPERRGGRVASVCFLLCRNG